MRRYFDYGVMHAQLPELLHELGAAEGDGLRFVASELRYIATVAPWRLPEVLVRNSGKYLGYRLGKAFRRVPNPVRRRLSMTKGFWDEAQVKNEA
jgi:rhamnosyltransferase